MHLVHSSKWSEEQLEYGSKTETQVTTGSAYLFSEVLTNSSHGLKLESHSALHTMNHLR